MIVSNRRIRIKWLAVESLLAMSVVALVLVGLAHPGAAKGPSSATLSGPGIDPPIDLTAAADPSLMHEVVAQTGLWHSAIAPLVREPAVADLGPRYTLRWVNSGPPNLSEEERTIHQYIYAHASLGLVIHTPEQAGLSGWGAGVTGWFDAPSGLQETLTALGAHIQGPGEPKQAVGPGEVARPPLRAVAAGTDAVLQPGGSALQNATSTSAVYVGALGMIVVVVALAVTVRLARLVGRSSRPVDRDSR